MVKPSAPLRRSRTRGDSEAAQRQARRAWTGGVRFSGFVVIMSLLAVLGVLVLIPTVGTYLDQRQQIRALESSVDLTQEQVEDLKAERERWKDPAFITTQARERLYYIRPGEVVYLVDDDLAPADVPREKAEISGEVEQTRTDWMAQLVRTTVSAGLARTVTATPSG